MGRAPFLTAEDDWSRDWRMRVRDDFARRAAVHPADGSWTPSPAGGVDRLLLDRVGAEVARATSLVRYAPDARFAPHRHDAGEEFIVLDGVFEDEHGAYPAGSYVRNPPGSGHAPRSREGCTLFVKLRQFEAGDRLPVNRSIDTVDWVPDRCDEDVMTAHLFSHHGEEVRFEWWEADSRRLLEPAGGVEILCLRGGFNEGGENFGRHSWLRLPPGQMLDAWTDGSGALVWVKEGHLAHLVEDACR